MYIALYRKWRPRKFEDIYGQEHITRTIKNEIKADKISHAYLLCGTRGTGKTTTAKILSKAVNCKNPIDHNPCDECESCTSINEGNSIDVFEIDAASNRGIDDIRELREAVRFTPTMGKYKVYIIDEVHMLTNEAFNALLKTLEEPPAYVLFILATTEPHKLPATILSRCQRFDFKRISVDNIMRRLKYICDNEGLDVEEDALRLISRNSDGAMRDALSILDQCTVFTGNSIKYEDALNVLGIVNNHMLFEISDAVGKEDCVKTIRLIDELTAGGKDINQLIKDLIAHYRNLLMAKVVDKLEDVIDMAKEAIEELKGQAHIYSKENIIRCINILSEVENTAKWTSQPRILLEVALIKMCRISSDFSFEGLQTRLAKLESVLANINTGKLETTLSDVKKDKQESIKAKEKKLKIKETSAPKDIMEKWNGIMQELKARKKIQLRTFLSTAKLLKAENGTFVISYSQEDSFAKQALEKPAVKSEVEGIMSEYLGQPIKLNIIFETDFNDVKVEPEEIDIVQKAIELFGKDLVEVIEEE